MFTGPGISKTISGPLRSQMDSFIDSFKQTGKPIALWSSSQEVEDIEFINTIETFGIPVFLSSEKAMKAIAALYKFTSHKNSLQHAD